MHALDSYALITFIFQTITWEKSQFVLGQGIYLQNSQQQQQNQKAGVRSRKKNKLSMVVSMHLL